MSRLENIDSVRRRAENEIQVLPQGDISSRGKQVRTTGEALKRRILRRVASPIVRLLQKRVRREVEFVFLHADALTIDERFANDMTLQKLLDRLGPVTKIRVLILACYIGGEAVLVAAGRGGSRWRRRLRPHSHMASGYPRASCAMGPVTLFPAGLGGAAALRRRKLRSHLFGCSDGASPQSARGGARDGAGLEAWTNGTAQLRAALHNIRRRPLHCGFWRRSRLLLEETEYRNKLANRDLFRDVTGDENLAFWAENEQFSYARPSDYVHIFSSHLNCIHAAQDQRGGPCLCRRRPDLWAELRGLGLAEEDLLVKSIVCILRKRE